MRQKREKKQGIKESRNQIFVDLNITRTTDIHGPVDGKFGALNDARQIKGSAKKLQS